MTGCDILMLLVRYDMDTVKSVANAWVGGHDFYLHRYRQGGPMLAINHDPKIIAAHVANHAFAIDALEALELRYSRTPVMLIGGGFECKNHYPYTISELKLTAELRAERDWIKQSERKQLDKDGNHNPNRRHANCHSSKINNRERSRKKRQSKNRRK